MHSLHHRKIDKCPVIPERYYKETSLESPVIRNVEVKRIYTSQGIKNAISEIKRAMLLSDGEQRIELAKEGLRLTTIALGMSNTINRVTLPQRKTMIRFRKIKPRGIKLSPDAIFSEERCDIHNESYRIYMQKATHPDGTKYRYPVLVCRLCYNARKRQLYREKKINYLSHLVGKEK